MMRFAAYCAMSMVFFTGALLSAQEKGTGNPPPMPPRQQEKQIGGRMFWRAFNSLPEERRRELLKMQTSDPEAFRKALKDRESELRSEMQKRFEVMKKIVADYKTALPPDQERLKAELSAMVREDYSRHMSEAKRHLEEMKRRTEFLEKELLRREALKEPAIAEQTDAILSGKLIPGERRAGLPKKK